MRFLFFVLSAILIQPVQAFEIEGISWGFDNLKKNNLTQTFQGVYYKADGEELREIVLAKGVSRESFAMYLCQAIGFKGVTVELAYSGTSNEVSSIVCSLDVVPKVDMVFAANKVSAAIIGAKTYYEPNISEMYISKWMGRGLDDLCIKLGHKRVVFHKNEAVDPEMIAWLLLESRTKSDGTPVFTPKYVPQAGATSFDYVKELTCE